MTTDQETQMTSKKPKTDETMTTPTKTKRDSSLKGASSPESDTSSNPLPFDFDTKKLENEFMLVPPKSLIFPPFDSRAEEGIIDADFQVSISESGVLQPITIAPVLKDGKLEYVIIDGRRRAKAALLANNAKNKLIRASIQLTNHKDAVMMALKLNDSHQSLTTFDRASTYQYMKTTLGMSQADISRETGRSAASVTNHLAVFSLDLRVQKMVRQGAFEPGSVSKVRELIHLKDPDQQYELAVKATADKNNPMRAEDIREYILRVKAREEEKIKNQAKRAKAKKRAAPAEEGEAEEVDVKETPSYKYDVKALQVQPKAKIHAFMEQLNAKVSRLRAASADPVKVSYEKGKLDALQQITGIKAMPKSLEGDE
jgi:ParB/RepB/Spo0J family partition protein